jgi:hexulose-6-phosphate isomerase
LLLLSLEGGLLDAPSNDNGYHREHQDHQEHEEQRMNHLKIGLTQVTAQVGGEALLDYAAKLGLAGVEPMIGTNDAEYLHWNDARAAQFLAHGRQASVAVPSVALGAFNEDGSLVDPAGAAKAQDLILRSLKFTHSVGAAVMLLCTYFRSHPDTPQKKAALVAVLKAVAPAAKEMGVTIALESPLPADELARVVRSAGTESVGVYYDVGNSIYLGFDVPAEIRALGPLIRAIHIKDTATMLGDSHLGKGRLDLPGTVQALKEIGYNGWLMLETPSGDESALRGDIQALKGLL